MTDVYSARRRFPRINSENVVLVKRVTADSDEGFVKTRVLGLGGCMLVCDEPMGVGTPVELLISVECRVVQAVGRVVYEIPSAPQRIDVGIEFLDLADSDREVIASLFESRGSGTSPSAA
jgi:hypothetical protein